MLPCSSAAAHEKAVEKADPPPSCASVAATAAWSVLVSLLKLGHRCSMSFEKSTPALRMRPLASHRVYETSNAPIRGALAENFPASVGAARWRVGRSWVPNDVSWLTDSACKSTLRSVQDDDEANSASVALSVSSAMSYASLEPLRWKVGRAATQRSKCTATFITIWRGLRSRSGRTAWPLPSRSGAQRTRGGLKCRDAVEVSGRLEAGQKEVALLCPLQHAFVTASWPLNTWPKCPLNL